VACGVEPCFPVSSRTSASEIRDPETSKDLDTGYFHSPENSGMTHLQFAVDASELLRGNSFA
jgi:hypothetical protein